MGTVVDKRRATRWGECGANVTKVGELFFNPLFTLYTLGAVHSFWALDEHTVANHEDVKLDHLYKSMAAVVARAY